MSQHPPGLPVNLRPDRKTVIHMPGCGRLTLALERSKKGVRLRVVGPAGMTIAHERMTAPTERVDTISGQ